MLIDRIRHNLDAVQTRVARAAARSGRDASSVTLVAVTKRQPVERLRMLVELGVTNLGENYPQELWEKAEALADLPIRWHLIGHLQSNKAKKTFSMVRMIHGVDSLKLVQSLDTLAQGMSEPPSVFLQVNASKEASKHGWSEDQLIRDAEALFRCFNIPIVGLMAMAGYDTTNEEARPTFAAVRQLRDRFRVVSDFALPELSMGMSGDFEAAIEEGATMIRVGSALFEGVDEGST